MEKLIELLNEKTNYEWVLWSNMNWDYLFIKWDKDNKFYEETIISKKFWFIDWLVKNDKIQSKYLTWWAKLINSRTYVEYSKTEQLIMDLSIQDNPIEWLCKILK